MQCWHLDLSTLAIMVLVVLADLQSLVVECLGKYAVGMEMQSIWPCLDFEHAACSWRSSGQRTHVNTQIHKRKNANPLTNMETPTHRETWKRHIGAHRDKGSSMQHDGGWLAGLWSANPDKSTYTNTHTNTHANTHTEKPTNVETQALKDRGRHRDSMQHVGGWLAGLRSANPGGKNARAVQLQ